MVRNNYRNLLSARTYTQLVKQLNWREQQERLKLKHQLKLTRTYGDLSENADYQLTKIDNKHNEIKINELKVLLSTTEIASVKQNHNRIELNVIIILKSDYCKYKFKTFCIVSKNEVMLNSTNIEISSSLAQNLLFKKRGDKIIITEFGLSIPYKIIYLL